MGSMTLVYELSAAYQSRAAGKELMIMLMDAQYRGDFAEVDSILSNADVTRLSAHALVGMVRCVQSSKGQLPSWQQTYERAWLEVVRRDRDPKALFVGLQDLSYLTED